MAKKAKDKKAAGAKSAKKRAGKKAPSKKAQLMSLAAGDAATLKSMLATAKPLAPFMCFRTADDDIFIKCDWNPVERRYNLNCRTATRSECQE